VTDWHEHNGGPQPVGDDVWVGAIVALPELHNLITHQAREASFLDWPNVLASRILNQHLIDAARLEGIRLGLEAAASVIDHDWPDPNSPIRNLDPATIVREATLDTLTAEAQAQGMGYDQHDTKRHPAALIGQEPTDD